MRYRFAALAISAAALAGCGGIDKPTAELAQARTAISQAETSNAPTYAPAELYKARQKLQQAEAASREDENLEALRLAEAAAADAELAQAKAQAETNRRSADEMQRSIRALQTQSQELVPSAGGGASASPEASGAGSTRPGPMPGISPSPPPGGRVQPFATNPL